MILYPAIDLLDGRCVRLSQGRFDQVTAYADDPVAVAERFAAAGASHLHVVDLAGSRDGQAAAAPLIKSLAALSGLSVQVGGGIRSLAQAKTYLDAGAAHVVLGSLAVNDPGATLEIVRDVGAARVTIAMDLRLSDAGVRIAANGWQSESAGISLGDFLSQYRDAGVTRVLCTDIGRDGMLSGPNLALYRDVIALTEIHLLASGGVATLEDLKALRAVGVHGVIVGKALYAGRFTLKEALSC